MRQWKRNASHPAPWRKLVSHFRGQVQTDHHWPDGAWRPSEPLQSLWRKASLGSRLAEHPDGVKAGQAVGTAWSVTLKYLELEQFLMRYNFNSVLQGRYSNIWRCFWFLQFWGSWGRVGATTGFSGQKPNTWLGILQNTGQAPAPTPSFSHQHQNSWSRVSMVPRLKNSQYKV